VYYIIIVVNSFLKDECFLKHPPDLEMLIFFNDSFWMNIYVLHPVSNKMFIDFFFGQVLPFYHGAHMYGGGGRLLLENTIVVSSY
jgi:hypothetical protein